MRAWVYRKDKTDPKGFHLFEERIPDPHPSPSQVLLKVEKVSVCGTDESLFKGDLKKVPDGVVPGHEFYGQILELGSEVKGLKVGQSVAGESHYHAPGDTAEGIIGLWGPEIKKNELLPPLNGAYAEYLCIPAECAYPVPAELVSEGFWPSLFEAIGNDYFLVKHSLRQSIPRHMGIVGCGPHGLFAQIFGRHFGIGQITAFEVDAFRRKFAADIAAADRVLDPRENLIERVKEATRGELFDVTLDMVGKQGQGFETCCETTADGGTIYLFGLFTGTFSIQDMPGNEIIFKMKTLTHEYKGKKLRVEGITGREGIWHELIETVCKRKDLQDHLMKPIHVLGNLEQLGADTHTLKPEIMKRAYFAFPR